MSIENTMRAIKQKRNYIAQAFVKNIEHNFITLEKDHLINFNLNNFFVI